MIRSRSYISVIDSSIFLHRSRVESIDFQSTSGGTSGFVLTGGHCGTFIISKFTKDNDVTITHKISLEANITNVKIFKLFAIIGLSNGMVRIFNSETGNELIHFRLADETQIDFLSVSKEDAKLIVIGQNNLMIIDLNDGKVKFNLKMSDQVVEVSSVMTSHHLTLITFWNGEIKVLNLNSAKFNQLSTQSDESGICSDIDNGTLKGITGGTEGTVLGWNLLNGMTHRTRYDSYIYVYYRTVVVYWKDK